MTQASASSTWHSVNPHTRPLTISILELTPLALTLSLTLAPPAALLSPPLPHPPHSASAAAAPSTPTPSLKQRKKARSIKRDSDDEHDEPDSEYSALLDPHTNFKDLLSHGVVVSVNGQPWNRIVAHVSDQDMDHDEEQAGNGDGDGDGDEEEWPQDEEEGVIKRRPRKARFGPSAGDAVKDSTTKARQRSTECKDAARLHQDCAVVVVYGLVPGKEYEIELRVVGLTAPESDPLVSNSVLIPSSPSPATSRSRANSLRSRSRPRSRSNSLSTPPHPTSGQNSSESLIAASPGLLSPNGNGSTPEHAPPIPTNILNPIDTQAAQIRHMIAAAHAEKEHVQTQIKEARRASQRAEAALRLEIETVKRATEKAGSLDLRAKQKTLALQEQVKQGWAGAEHADQQAAELEGGHHELESKLQSTRVQVDAAQAEWKVAKTEEDRVRARDRKARHDEEKKLADVVGKIDKLRIKKEKKQTEKLDLEKKLVELVKHAEEIEKRNEEERLSVPFAAAAANAAAGGGGTGAAGVFWRDPYAHQHNHHQQQLGLSAQGGHDSRTLTNHPSLSNLNPRGRGGFGGGGGRYPSTGNVRPSPSQPSPTHASFYPSTTPVFRPSIPAGSPKPSPPPVLGGRSSSGVNVAAVPFHPTAYIPPLSPSGPTGGGTGLGASGNAVANTAASSTSTVATSASKHSNGDHTTLMPPQLQHRIYLSNPNMRPRPTPNFNPPPSVRAERQSPTTLSTPASPPLPIVSPTGVSGTNNIVGVSNGAGGNNTSVPSSPLGPAPAKSPVPGPSLASIVTRAVLSPTALAERGIAQSSGAGSSGSPLPATPGERAEFGAPSGPWNVGSGIQRTGTPPVRLQSR